MDTSIEHIQDMIDALGTDRNNAAARDHFNAAMQQKIATELEAKRVDVAQQMFNQVPEDGTAEEE